MAGQPGRVIPFAFRVLCWVPASGIKRQEDAGGREPYVALIPGLTTPQVQFNVKFSPWKYVSTWQPAGGMNCCILVPGDKLGSAFCQVFSPIQLWFMHQRSFLLADLIWFHLLLLCVRKIGETVLSNIPATSWFMNTPSTGERFRSHP